MFTIELTEEALKDLKFLKRYEQVRVIDIVEKQLQREPTRQTRNRKPLRPNELSEWELRVDKYRVFYDVGLENEIVKIKAVGWKEHNRVFIRGKEFIL
jgi:mRNA-degrading endonuclease RelE of RelBE toxin-antitoxin system